MREREKINGWSVAVEREIKKERKGIQRVISMRNEKKKEKEARERIMVVDTYGRRK